MISHASYPMYSNNWGLFIWWGSLASSLHGIPRATQDIDIVADLNGSPLKAFVQATQDEFYVDEEMILDALKHRSSFNVLNYAIRGKTVDERDLRIAISFEGDGNSELLIINVIDMDVKDED